MSPAGKLVGPAEVHKQDYILDRRLLWSEEHTHTNEVAMVYPMHPDLKVGNKFPDFELPDQDEKAQRLSKLIRGFPTVLIFSRGYY